MVLPIVVGGIVISGVYLLDWFPDWSAFKRYMVVAGSLIGSYKAPDIFLSNKVAKRTAAWIISIDSVVPKKIGLSPKPCER